MSVAAAETPTIPGVSSAEADATFEKLNAFVAQWEGGYVDHHRDDGGLTNMDITQATLSAERGREVTKEEVEALTRAEANAIYRKKYYGVARCGEMPERTAAVVYNGSVLHGVRGSGKFLQTALNDLGQRADGAKLVVDGIIGRKTLAGVRYVSPVALSDAYMSQQEAYLRRHSDFDVFGKGWMNRMASLRSFVDTLPRGAGASPKVVMKIQEKDHILSGAGDLLGSVLGGQGANGLSDLLAPVLDGDPTTGLDRDNLKAVARQAALAAIAARFGINTPAIVPTAGGEKVLTPVNSALGQGVGKLMDGKKTVLGLVGVLLTVLTPQIPALGLLKPFIDQVAPIALPILSTLLGWGAMGKIDKAIYAANGVNSAQP